MRAESAVGPRLSDESTLHAIALAGRLRGEELGVGDGLFAVVRPQYFLFPGNVIADCGTITIDFTTDPWTVLHEGGPHPLLHEGYGALCDYLAS